MSFLAVVLSLQVATFVLLGGYFIGTGDTRFGLAQLLLAGVTGLIYA